MDFIEAPSPNFDARNAPPEILLLHYTGMRSGEAACARLIDADADRVRFIEARQDNGELELIDG